MAFGQPDGGFLEQASSGFAPAAQGWAQPFTTPASGLGLDPLMGMALQSTLGSVMPNATFSPLGNPDQNTYDYMLAMRFTKMQQRMLSEAAQMDKASFTQTFRGMAAMAGLKETEAMHKAMYSAASGLAFAEPILGQMFPEMIDALAGPMGSNVVMQQSLLSGGRYRMDPVTGQMGYSEASHEQLRASINENLFGRAFNASTGEWSAPSSAAVGGLHGLTMGQTGQMFDELQRRGLVASSLNRDAEVSRAGQALGKDTKNMSPNELDQMMSSPQFEQQMRGFDAQRVGQTVSKYAAAVSAVRDLFGDMGRPNAPMAELFSSLDALTQGSMTQLDPTRVANMVRQTHNIAKIAGVSIDTAVAMQQHAAVVAQGFGIEPVFAVSANQGAMAWGAGARGHLTDRDGVGAWGLSDLSGQMQLNSNLRVAASASAVSNRMGAALRMSEAVGGFAPGSGAANLVDALKSHDGEFDDGSGRTRNIASVRDSEFTRMMVAGGRGNVNANSVSGFLTAHAANREYVESNGVGDTVKDFGQRYDFQRDLRIQFQNVFQQQLTASGISDPKHDLARRAASEAVENLTNPKDGDRGVQLHSHDRAMAIGGALQHVVGGGRISDEKAALFGEQQFGQADRMSGIRYHTPLQNMLFQNNREATEDGIRVRQEAATAGEMQEGVSSLGRGGVLRRLVGAVQEAGVDADSATIPGLLKNVFTSDPKMRGALEKPLTDYKEALDDWRKAKLRLDNTPRGTPEYRRLQHEVQAKREAMGRTGAAIRTASDQAGGAVVSTNISDEEMNDVHDQTSAAMTEGHRVRGGKDDWDEYSRTSAGREFSGNVSNAMSGTSSAIAGMLTDDQSNGFMAKLGPEGLDKLERAQEAHATLTGLAAKYTNGDVGRLISGKFEADNKAEIMSQVDGASSDMQSGMDNARSVQQGKTAAWGGTDAEKKDFLAGRVKTAKKAAGLSDSQVAAKLAESFGFTMRPEFKIGKGGGADARQILHSREDLLDIASKHGYKKEDADKFLADVDSGTVHLDAKEQSQLSRDQGVLSATGFDHPGNSGTFATRLSGLGGAGLRGASGSTAAARDIHMSGTLVLKDDGTVHIVATGTEGTPTGIA